MGVFSYNYEKNSDALHIVSPLAESPKLSDLAKHEVLLKLDNLQPAGSFKIRGIGKLVQQAKIDGKKTAVASSAGNAGMAASYACAKIGLPCTVFLPKSTPEFAAGNIAEHGAEVIYHGEIWDESNEEALKRLVDDSVLYIHPFNHPTIWEGHATLVDELVEQLKGKKPGLMVCAVGGGGLLMGVLIGLQRNN
ncbi:unnamed protein product [Oikopleura dioica]|uniref:L-serine ammonia-lyase n=1 Tax=Oikopleura dioica TaxID=34765 RepID=E4XJI6_OIKDI|nr:unnamed protein product [Oikopleura dioica]